MRIGHPAIWIGVLLFAAIGALPARAGGRVLTNADVVAIRIVDHPELDTTTRVEPDGTINFPYVGRIRAAGRTRRRLGARRLAAAGRVENRGRALRQGSEGEGRG